MVTDSDVAEIVAIAFEPTLVVLMANVADVFPARTVTVLGTVADERLLDRAITSPPFGAGEVSETVPVLELPPFTVEGLTENDFNAGADTVRVAAFETVPSSAFSITVAFVDTGTVFTENIAELFPSSTVTLFGAVADGELLDSATRIPPLPAGPLNVIVPMESAPPLTVCGLTVIEASVAG
jgi:hypothetical protein